MNQMQATNIRPLVVSAGTGIFFDLGDHRGHVKISSEQSGDFTLIESIADPNGGVPLHVHTKEDELFYILEGKFAIQVGEDTIIAGPGDTVFAPRHIPHSWFCVGETPGRFYLVITPGANFEKFGMEMAQRNFVPTRDMADPVMAAEFLALTAQHGIFMLPPDKAMSAATIKNLALPTMHAPLYIPAGEGIFVELGDHRGWGKVGAHHTGNALLLSETHADLNGGVPPHIHGREDETFTILEGEFTFALGGYTVTVGPGDTVFGPRDVVHGWKCNSDNGKLLILFTPGDNFQAFALAMGAQNANPQEDMAADDAARTAAFVALAAQYGIQMIAPAK